LNSKILNGKGIPNICMTFELFTFIFYIIELNFINFNRCLFLSVFFVLFKNNSNI
jgi:hypothetical protein